MKVFAVMYFMYFISGVDYPLCQLFRGMSPRSRGSPRPAS